MSGSVAKWLRQRIANPPSSVRLRPEPLLLKPLRCADNSGLRRGFFVFSRARLGVVGKPHRNSRPGPRQDAPRPVPAREKGASHQKWRSWHLAQIWWLAPFSPFSSRQAAPRTDRTRLPRFGKSIWKSASGQRGSGNAQTFSQIKAPRLFRSPRVPHAGLAARPHYREDAERVTGFAAFSPAT